MQLAWMYHKSMYTGGRQRLRPCALFGLKTDKRTAGLLPAVVDARVRYLRAGFEEGPPSRVYRVCLQQGLCSERGGLGLK